MATALVAISVFLCLFPGCGDLSRDELNRGAESESLSALAAQGELVANGVARDATKSTYARVMAKTLGGEAEHEAEKLADAEPEAAVTSERNAAVQVAGSWPASSRNCRLSLATSTMAPSWKSTWVKSKNGLTRSSLA